MLNKVVLYATYVQSHREGQIAPERQGISGLKSMWT